MMDVNNDDIIADYDSEEYHDANRQRWLEFINIMKKYYLNETHQNIFGNANIAEYDPALECEKCDSTNVEDCIRVPKSSFTKMLEILQAHGYRINDKFEVTD